MNKNFLGLAGISFLLSAGQCVAQAPASPILLHVDLTDGRAISCMLICRYL